MTKDIQFIGSKTDLMDVTSTSAAKALSQANSLYLIFDNNGTSDVFVNTGNSTVSVTFPTTSTGQNGAYIGAGVKQVIFKKNSPRDTHLAAITASGTSTIVIKAADGK